MTNKEKITKLAEALHFYADPDNYFAIGFFPDRPCGEFIEDFKDDYWEDFGSGIVYERPMPGQLAREVLREVEEI